MHTLIIYVAKYLVFLVPLVVLILFARQPKEEKRRMAILLAVGGIVTAVLVKTGNMLIHDPRPFIAGHYSPWFMSSTDNGFPSDHTVLAAFLAFVILSFSRPLGILFLVIAAAIGTARVVSHVHHLWDVLGGFGFALVGWLLSVLIYKWMQTRLEHRAAAETTE